MSIYENSDRTEQYVQDEDGRTVDYAAAVELMDDDLREQLHMEMAPCTNQEFFEAYVKAHAAKYNGEKFQIWTTWVGRKPHHHLKGVEIMEVKELIKKYNLRAV